MPKTVTEQQFREATPGYVGRAFVFSSQILNRAIADPMSGIQVQATVCSDAPPEYRAIVTDPEQLAKLWETRKDLMGLEADIPMEGARLAINDTVGAMNRHLRVWVYTPPIEPLTLPRIELRDLDDEIEVGPKRPRSDWIGSSARLYLGTLALPGYIFKEGWATAEQGGHDSATLPVIFAYVHTSSDTAAKRVTFQSASAVPNIPAATITQAIAPACTKLDAEMLGKSKETYHTAKIEMLLAMMGGVALG